MKIPFALSATLISTSSLILSACVTPDMMVDMATSMAETAVKVNGMEQYVKYDVNKKTCATLDWDVLGYENAHQEKPREVANLFGEYCPQKGYLFKRSEYEAGYERGLAKLCTAKLAQTRKDSLTFFAKNSSIKGMGSPCLEIEEYAAIYKLSGEAEAAMLTRGEYYNQGNELAVELNDLARIINTKKVGSPSYTYHAEQYNEKVAHYNDIMAKASTITFRHQLPKTTIRRVELIAVHGVK